MMNMYSKYDNMHTNDINYAIKCINSHAISSIHFMLLVFTQLSVRMTQIVRMECGRLVDICI